MITITLTPEQLVAIAAQQAGSSPAATQPTPVVPAGFVLLPITNHLLPLPKPEQASFWGYLLNAWQSAGGKVGQQSPMWASRGLALQADAERRSVEQLGRDSWPEAVDRLYNVDAYDPQGKAGRDAATAAAEQGVWISGGGGQAAAAPAATTEEI